MLKYVAMFWLAIMVFSNATTLCRGVEIIVELNSRRFMTYRTKIFAKCNSEFAFDLFREVAAQSGTENVFISPLVVSMGLSMILEGADNTTRDQLLEVLKLNSKLSYRYIGANLGFYYEKYNMYAKPEMSTAVKLFADKSMTFQEQFLLETSRYAGHKLEQVDFAEHPEESRISINKWVEKETRKQIKSIFPPGSISAQTKFVLASTMYFKGQWENQFDQAMPGVFYVTEERTVRAQMMTRQRLVVRNMYDFSTGLGYVELPYQYKKGGLRVSMILIIDDFNPGFDVAESRLTYQATEQAITALMKKNATETDVTLPKFNMTHSYDLSCPLKAMGITDIFSPKHAKFSRMTSASENLYLSKALHKTFFVVDDGRSNSSAPSESQLTALSLDGYFFNKPFHFLIYEKITKAILFMGRVANPIAN